MDLEQPGQQALQALQLLTFMTEQGGAPHLEAGALLRKVEERRAALSVELGPLVQLEALRLLQAVTSSAPPLTPPCWPSTRDTIQLLLKGVCGEGRPRSTAATILT